MVEGADKPPNAPGGWPHTALSSGDRRRRDGAAAASGPGRRAPAAWMPSPTSCSRCLHFSARAPAGHRRAAQRHDRQSAGRAVRDQRRRGPARVPVGAAGRARDRPLGGARLRRLVGDRAAAPRRSRATPPTRAYDWSALDADVARYRAPAWPCSSRSGACRPGPTAGRRPNTWPLVAQDLGDFAYAVALRYPQVRSVLRLERAQHAHVRRAEHGRGLRADGARGLRRRARRQSRAAQVAAGNLARYRDAGRDPAVWAARLRADGVPMDLLRHPPVPDAARAAGGARSAQPHRPARRARAGAAGRRPRDRVGVRLVVRRRRRRAAGRVDGAGDRARPLHAGPRRLRLLGLPRPPGAARRHAGSLGALRLAGRRRAAQARLPRGLRRPARPARLHGGRPGRRRARGLAAASARSRSRRTPIRRRGARPRGRGRAGRGS